MQSHDPIYTDRHIYCITTNRITQIIIIGQTGQIWTVHVHERSKDYRIAGTSVLSKF